MIEITTIGAQPRQTFSIPLEGYDAIGVTMEFKPEQYCWFISIVWGNWGASNERVIASPNMLRQFVDILPFGFLISGPGSLDPFSVDAWQNGWKFYLLDTTDIAEVEALYVRE